MEYADLDGFEWSNQMRWWMSEDKKQRKFIQPSAERVFKWG